MSHCLGMISELYELPMADEAWRIYFDKWKNDCFKDHERCVNDVEEVVVHEKNYMT